MNTQKSESVVTFSDDIDLKNILLDGRANRAVTLNEIRHLYTNYEDALRLIEERGTAYEDIKNSAIRAVETLVSNSTLNKYEKYLYILHIKNWNFHKSYKK